MKPFERIFNRWTKWEIYKENVQMVKRTTIVGLESFDWHGHESPVIVDIYVKTNKFNGLKKYKQVVKEG